MTQKRFVRNEYFCNSFWYKILYFSANIFSIKNEKWNEFFPLSLPKIDLGIDLWVYFGQKNQVHICVKLKKKKYRSFDLVTPYSIPSLVVGSSLQRKSCFLISQSFSLRKYYEKCVYFIRGLTWCITVCTQRIFRRKHSLTTLPIDEENIRGKLDKWPISYHIFL